MTEGAKLERTLSFAISTTKLGKEHRSICEAMGGTLPDATTFQRERYHPKALSEAAAFWHTRTLAEHRSVAVFLLLATQLIEANASLDAKTVMVKLAQDEFRHTELCGQMLTVLGNERPVVGDVAVNALATHAGCSLQERALRNVLYTTCLSEMVATARLVDTLEHTTDEYARAITRLIIRDEVMHGHFGFLYLEQNADYLQHTPGLVDSLGTYLQHAFAVLETELASDALRVMARPSEQAKALGVIDPRRAIDVFYGTMEHAVVPALEMTGIAAKKAWVERRIG